MRKAHSKCNKKYCLSLVFHMPELISIKQGSGHPKNFTNWYKMKNVKFE